MLRRQDLLFEIQLERHVEQSIKRLRVRARKGKAGGVAIVVPFQATGHERLIKMAVDAKGPQCSLIEPCAIIKVQHIDRHIGGDCIYLVDSRQTTLGELIG